MANETEFSFSATLDEASLPNIKSNLSTMSSDQPPVAGPVFTVFTKMPFELQNMIWTIAAYEPRIVEIHSYTKYFRQNERKKSEVRLLSRTLAPAILHTCTRSRKTGLKLYEKLCFRDRATGSYINWACDYIRFNCPSYVVRSSLDLAPIYERCQRMIILASEFEGWSWNWSHKFEKIEQLVLLCRIAEPSDSKHVGNLTLAPINDPRLSDSPPHFLERDRKKEQQIKTLMQVDDLAAFAVALNTPSPAGGGRGLHVDGQQWFNRWDARRLIEAFGKVRKRCNSIVVMHAIRGKEQAMTKEQKTDRKRKTELEAQRLYRMAHPEIPWHEHGFQDSCPCAECSSQ